MNKTLKSVLILISLIAALGVVGALISSFMGPSIKTGSVIHLTFNGALTELPRQDLRSMLMGKQTLSLFSTAAAIRKAAEDEDIKGLFLEIKNPEMGFAQLQEIESAMAVFRASEKWSAAFLESAGEFSRGDGAYALAAMTDKIVLAPPGDVALLGLRAEVPFVKGLLDKLKVSAHVEQRHGFKNMANMFNQENFTDQHRLALSELLDDLQMQLVEHVAARRTKTIAEVQAWVNGGPVGAAEALEMGMVDTLGYWDSIHVEIMKLCEDDDERFISLAEYIEGSDAKFDSGKKIALITGEGSIHRGSSAGGMDSPSIGSDTFARALSDARKDEVAGILIRIDSPGGSYIASDLVRREVKLCKDAGIPVVVSMGNVAASGGYFIAMEADHIVAERGTITGSIGVLAILPALREFYQSFLGVTFDTYETGAMAGTFSTLDPPGPPQSKDNSDAKERIYPDFVTKAASGRGKTYDEIHEIAQGRVWSGDDALEKGLVDELGGTFTALSAVAQRAGAVTKEGKLPQVELIRYPEAKTGLALLLDDGQASVGLQSPDSQIEALLGAVEKRIGVQFPRQRAGVLELPWVPRL